VPVKYPPAPPPPPASFPPEPPPATSKYSSTTLTPVGAVHVPDALNVTTTVLVKFHTGFLTALVREELICGFNPRFAIEIYDPVLKPILGYFCSKYTK
jgi:hypothetical protein